MRGKIKYKYVIAIILTVLTLISLTSLFVREGVKMRESLFELPKNLVLPPIGSYPWDNARGFIRVSEDGDHFEFEDGTPFFVIGVNYEGWYDRCWRMWEDELFDLKLIERDFRKMRFLGINVVRIFIQGPLAKDILRGDFTKLDEVVRLAKRYRVYILLTLWDYGATLEEALRVAERIASRYYNETIIFAYDLKNEPSLELIVDKERWHEWLKSRYGSVKELDNAWRNVNPEYALKNYETDFSKIEIPREVWNSPRWADFMRYLNEALEEWLKVQIQAIRRYDRNHLITVGYNDFRLALLPANNLLDFISIHTYFNELDEVKQRPSLLCLDILKAYFPDKPILYEEFGLSNAVADYQVSCAKEMTIYAYLFFKGFAGGLKWMLNDHILNPNKYERLFGIFTLKGDKEYLKPIGIALKGFSSAVVERIKEGSIPSYKGEMIQLIDNPPYREQIPWEYCSTIWYLPLYHYYFTLEDKGKIAVYPMSCYGYKEVEEQVVKILNRKLMLLIRPLSYVQTFTPWKVERYSRLSLFNIPFENYGECKVVINGKVIRVMNAGDIVIIKGGEILLKSKNDVPLITRLGNVVSLPFINILENIPLEMMKQFFKKVNLTRTNEVGGLIIGGNEKVPLGSIFEDQELIMLVGLNKSKSVKVCSKNCLTSIFIIKKRNIELIITNPCRLQIKRDLLQHLGNRVVILYERLTGEREKVKEITLKGDLVSLTLRQAGIYLVKGVD